MVLAGLWVAAGYAVWTAWRRGERAIVVLAAGALAWIAVVAVLAAAGYAGIPRFAAPAAAIGCVLGGVGAVRLAGAARRRRGQRPRAGARWRPPARRSRCAIAVQGAIRAGDLPATLAARRRTSATASRTCSRSVDDAGRRREVVACGPVTTSDFLTETALAWKLELALGEVERRVASAPRGGDLVPRRRRARRGAGGRCSRPATPIARRGRLDRIRGRLWK